MQTSAYATKPAISATLRQNGSTLNVGTLSATSTTAAASSADSNRGNMLPPRRLLFPYQGVQHRMELRGRPFDVAILVLASASLRGQHRAAMNALEVTKGEPVAALAAFCLLV